MSAVPPNVPEALAVLAGEWWGLALQQASVTALNTLASDRTALQMERDALRQDREEFASEAGALREQVNTATHAEQVATTQATELQRLVGQLEGRVEEMTKQRDDALARLTEADLARQAVDVRIQVLQESASTEREALAQHARAVEDRAHTEIDRARQETKELQARLVAANKEHAVVTKSHFQAAEQAKAAAAEATRDAGIERARADVLEKQLAQLQDLPAALEAAMRKTQAGPKQRKPGGSEQAVRGAGKRAKAHVGS